MIDYVKVGIIVGLCTIVFGSGYWMGYSRYLDYKKSVEIAAKEQESKVESIKKQQEITTKGIEDEYNAKLALIRQYYSNGMRSNSSGNVSNISTTSAIANATAAYNELARSCAETTIQLVELQKWINEQIGIK